MIRHKVRFVMIILDKPVDLDYVRNLAENGLFLEMVKGVVDVGRCKIALDAELHSDLEAIMLEDGSEQKDLWGINLYPDYDEDDFIEFDSLINIRPWQGNRSRDVENAEVREKICDIVKKYIVR